MKPEDKPKFKKDKNLRRLFVIHHKNESPHQGRVYREEDVVYRISKADWSNEYTIREVFLGDMLKPSKKRLHVEDFIEKV